VQWLLGWAFISTNIKGPKSYLGSTLRFCLKFLFWILLEFLVIFVKLLVVLFCFLFFTLKFSEHHIFLFFLFFPLASHLFFLPLQLCFDIIPMLLLQHCACIALLTPCLCVSQFCSYVALTLCMHCSFDSTFVCTPTFLVVISSGYCKVH
jgi:hypothetical protein